MTRMPRLATLLTVAALTACSAEDDAGASASGSSGSDTGTASGSGSTAPASATVASAEATAATIGESSDGDSGGSDESSDSTGAEIPTEPFSFFVTSLRALQELSDNEQGFGGDLRFGERGPGAGLRGADLICATIAEQSMPGAANKQWRAFLSATDDGAGSPVAAIDRVGEGPWYDRLGRTFALTKADLLTERPTNIDPAIKDDFPNEDGVPNHQPDPTQPEVDNHDTLTGTNEFGELYSPTATCLDWTSSLGDSAIDGLPRVGHMWPRYGGPPGGGGGGPGGDINPANWMSSLDESGCAPGVNLLETGPPDFNQNTVGSGGGYGAFYCFALYP